jgi:hypothetical protein
LSLVTKGTPRSSGCVDPKSVTPDELYGVAADILHLHIDLAEDAVLDEDCLPAV